MGTHALTIRVGKARAETLRKRRPAKAKAFSGNESASNAASTSDLRGRGPWTIDLSPGIKAPLPDHLRGVLLPDNTELESVDMSMLAPMARLFIAPTDHLTFMLPRQAQFGNMGLRGSIDHEAAAAALQTAHSQICKEKGVDTKQVAPRVSLRDDRFDKLRDRYARKDWLIGGRDAVSRALERDLGTVVQLDH